MRHFLIFCAFTSAVISPASAAPCDPNYSGACVPIASDVDCASGSGNGPAYVRGPVRVIGKDIYGLDRDNDGIGCENG
ncbi:excalibur calcium-binding domain-containing protein [Lentibacter algarum]|nr:excalibur calcium-binding domain-containing protein [Lentibacter algarum]